MNSPKSVIEKLNFSKYPNKLILHIPDDIEDFQDTDYDSSIKKDQYDLIFVFIYSLEEFSTNLQEVIEKKLLSDNGYLFFAYPKKNNKKYEQYIERDSFFETGKIDEDGFVPGSDIKFSRMISMNDVFTVVGLKSVLKKAKAKKTAQKSQRVDDYIEHVDDIKNHLENNEELLKTYNELTPGYQKDWARFVYIAKRKETQEKRLVEMETVLGEGYKSMDLYRRNN